MGDRDGSKSRSSAPDHARTDARPAPVAYPLTAERLDALTRADPADPVEIAPGVFWVGHYLEGDPFQCHVYLIVHGDQCVLIDPGSRLTFPHTLPKIERVTAFANIRYFVCHHQDPDIVGALDTIGALVDRPDAVIVTHQRAAVLLRHLDVPLPFWLVDQNGWRLDLGGRVLDFVFTPYMHFPGAFTTFDRDTGVLFSSDIFGGFTDGFALVARDASYFEALRPFHEHYMPSREVVRHGLSRLAELPIELIAPQHGSLIPKPLIQTIFRRLARLECGIYLLAQGGDTDIMRLSDVNRLLKNLMRSMVLYRDFRDLVAPLLALVGRLLPVNDLAFFAGDISAEADDGPARADRRRGDPTGRPALLLSAPNQYRGVTTGLPEPLAPLFGLDRPGVEGLLGARCLLVGLRLDPDDAERPCLVVPLFHPTRGVADAFAVLVLEREVELDAPTVALLDEIWVPLEAAIERERIFRSLERERERIYEQSIRDPLTGLFTRVYMRDQAERLIAQHDRDANQRFALILLDLDHFKAINDDFGHLAGDDVLRVVGRVVLDACRTVDLPVRYGGEEFAVFVWGCLEAGAFALAERIRLAVAHADLGPTLNGRRVTVSGGVASHRAGEDLVDLIGAADAALYEAKVAGRDRNVVAPRHRAGAPSPPAALD